MGQGDEHVKKNLDIDYVIIVHIYGRTYQFAQVERRRQVYDCCHLYHAIIDNMRAACMAAMVLHRLTEISFT